MPEHYPAGHLATLDGDLDDLTPDEARLVPACDATDVAVMWVMGWRVEVREVETKYTGWPYLVPPQNIDKRATKTEIKKAKPPLGCRFSRKPKYAHKAREWLRSKLYSVRSKDCETGVVEWVEDSFGSKYPERPVHGDTLMLARARLILVLHAMGEL